MTSSSDNSCNYVQVTGREHVLQRPSMYIGSTTPKQQSEYVLKDNKLVLETVDYNEGLIKLYNEAVSNAADNWNRSIKSKTPVTLIKISVDQATGLTQVWNDGLGVPLSVDANTGLKIPEMIFGNLLTSSNFDDNVERTASGVFGIGAKAINIFSKLFTVDIGNKTQGKLYKQVWRDNMEIVEDAVITEAEEGCLSGNFVNVSWIPDFSKFGQTGYSDDNLRIMAKLAYDLATITGVKVVFNEKALEFSDFEKYCDLFHQDVEIHQVDVDEANDQAEDADAQSEAGSTISQTNIRKQRIVLKLKNATVVLEPHLESEAITFVNGIYLKEGIHVKQFIEFFLKPVVEALNESQKKSDAKQKLTLKEVSAKFRIFIKMSLDKPEFTSASKSCLSGPKIVLPTTGEKKNTKTIMSWSNVLELKQLLVFKANSGLRKLEKSTGYVKIANYSRANFAGTKRAQETILFIVEGLSASCFFDAGVDSECLGKTSRDFFGVLPIKGKILNCLAANASQIQKNTEVKSIIQALGLKQGLDYTLTENRKTLNYGQLVILVDADDDGIHVLFLLLTLFNTLYPTLVKCNTFLFFMRTPIISVKSQGKVKHFYDQRRAETYISSNHIDAKNISYYKGLGSLPSTLIKEIFGKYMGRYELDDEGERLLIEAFHKSTADVRKTWMNERLPPTLQDLPDDGTRVVETVRIADSVKNDLPIYAMANCMRSIPNLVDGLKESQRKILFAFFKKNLSFQSPGLKTAQISSYTAETTAYRHGESIISDTIARMAHSFTGANNLNLVDPSLSQLGSRQHLGAVFSSPRYTKVRAAKLTPYIFRKEDFDVLDYIVDEGQSIEPVQYVPILPLLLANGSAGIATGFSCTVPNYNPVDLVEIVRRKLSDPLFEADLIPWYRGFKGKITRTANKNKFRVEGLLENIGRDQVKVTEIPISLSVQAFQDSVEKLIETNEIKKLANHTKGDDLSFLITCHRDGHRPTLESLKLYEYLHTSNLTLWEGKIIRRFETVNEVIDVFMNERLRLYVKRLAHQTKKMEHEASLLQIRTRFIKLVLEGVIVINRKSKAEIVQQLVEHNFEDDSQNNSLDHAKLLSISVSAFSQEELDKLKLKLEETLKNLAAHKKLKVQDVWTAELDEFLLEYKKQEKIK